MEDQSFVTLKDFGVISENEAKTRQILARVVRTPTGVLGLDLREHVTTKKYTGFTNKGVLLQQDALEKLVSGNVVENALKLLRKTGGA